VVVAETMDLEHLGPFHKKEQNLEDQAAVAVVPVMEQHQTEMVELELPTKVMLVELVVMVHQQVLMLAQAVEVLVLLVQMRQPQHLAMAVLDLELRLLDQTILLEHLDLGHQLVDG
tara:strand:- start:797 stop:1144 length:348 start_codon:yes stop_codon:yes gene_type:complete